jgi:hypothetical protein
MARRSTARRVEEFVLFDVLYEDRSRTSNRKVPGSKLGGIDGDLSAKTYIETQDRQIGEISGKAPDPDQILNPRAAPLRSGEIAVLPSNQERVQPSAGLCP